jgi:uncharacterized Rossmann fold enzyme
MVNLMQLSRECDQIAAEFYNSDANTKKMVYKNWLKKVKLTVKPLAPRSKKLCDKKLDEVKLYEGSSILQLAASGLSLDACCSGLDACRLLLEELGA